MTAGVVQARQCGLGLRRDALQLVGHELVQLKDGLVVFLAQTVRVKQLQHRGRAVGPLRQQRTGKGATERRNIVENLSRVDVSTSKRKRGDRVVPYRILRCAADSTARAHLEVGQQPLPARGLRVLTQPRREINRSERA